jgi:hypothetical protein
MGPSHGPRIPRTWRLQTFSCGGMSSHLCTDKHHRMKLTSDRRSPLPLHRSLRKRCEPRGATCPRGMNCATSAAAIMLTANALMCWDAKVLSLLHVFVPLTGKKVDSFLQRFRFFLWQFKRITLYISYICHYFTFRKLVLRKLHSQSVDTMWFFKYLPSERTETPHMEIIHCAILGNRFVKFT